LAVHHGLAHVQNLEASNGSDLLLAEPGGDPSGKTIAVLVKAGVGDVPLSATILKKMPEGVGDDHRLVAVNDGLGSIAKR
jgi:hypothetical protein